MAMPIGANLPRTAAVQAAFFTDVKKADPRVGFLLPLGQDQSREPPRPSSDRRCEKIMYTSRYRLRVARM